MKKVEFFTKDEVGIAGDYYPVAESRQAVILLHMMPATRTSWREFADLLAQNGIAALAIDLRGHGDSLKTKSGAKLNYCDFADAEHQASIRDVRAAAVWLKEEGMEVVGVVGASIGANLALQYLAESAEAKSSGKNGMIARSANGGFGVKNAALLSPGLNYRGIGALPLASKLSADKKVLLVAAKDDKNVDGAVEGATEIYEALTCERSMKIFETGGHGTDIFDAHPEFMEELIKFFKEK
jgi:alpha-beta hydrolase superfamily lysophospholipase